MDTKILHAALFTPRSGGGWGLPMLLWGPPGVAKSAIVRQVAAELGWHCEVLAPGERGEGAFGVTPVPDGEVLRYPPPEWVASLRVPGGEEEGLVFVDELTTAPPALQPAMLGLVQERRIGGHQLGRRVRVIGAANPPEQAAAGWDLAAPVANRFGHLAWAGPTADQWAEWLVGSSAAASVEPSDPRLEEAMVTAAWPVAWASAAGQVAAFLRRRPQLLHKIPADGDPAMGRAWPSPRTWEYAARALASARVHRLTDDEADRFVAAFVGDAAYQEFAAWLAAQDLPDPAAVLDGGGWAPDYDRLDRTEAVLGSCVALVLGVEERRAERVAALYRLAARIAERAKDVVLPAVTMLVKAGHTKDPAALKLLADLHLVVAGSEG